MHRKKDRETEPLSAELFPFSGKLRKDNRWLKSVSIFLERLLFSRTMAPTGKMRSPAPTWRGGWG